MGGLALADVARQGPAASLREMIVCPSQQFLLETRPARDLTRGARTTPSPGC